MMRIRAIDTHTAGEPTRVIVAGGPELGLVEPAEARNRLCEQYDWLRTAAVLEPRGSDAWVAAALLPPTDPDCCAGVVFLNNAGALGMCGHGTIGVAVALGYLGRIGPGQHRLQTPVGTVEFDYDGANGVALDNVPSWRLATDVCVEVPDLGPVSGDIAWGGNWFFLTDEAPCPLELAQVGRLTEFCRAIRRALTAYGITGANGAEIDHIELSGPPGHPDHHARNFVLCPGGAYDRSPCGTGTSAKLACLAADGRLAPGELWRQESVIGSVFTGSYRPLEQGVLPTIRGTAYVTAETTLILDPADPLRFGIVS
jgi:proline racemase